MTIRLFDKEEQTVLAQIEVPAEIHSEPTQKPYASNDGLVPKPDVIRWNGRYFLSAAMVELTGLGASDYFEINGHEA